MTVHLFTMGGTISMAGRTDRGDIRLGGEQLLQDVGESLRGIEVAVRDVRAVPSAHLSFSDILEIADRAGEAVEQGASGIVLVQGTDTIEESAFILDCVWPHDAPLVVTGAMRNPRLPGADGPANLVAAIRVAASAAARERGVLVVLNDEIHAARLVRKAHSMSTAAFTSPDLGPVGHLVEGALHLLAGVPRTETVPGVAGDRVAATKVALHTVTMEDDGTSLSGLRDTHHGLVVAAFGVGHVPAAMAPVLGDLAAHLPVVLTSRTGAGPVLADTYGAPGSERDLRERGLVNGGFLHPLKARVLLRLLLASGHDTAAIASRFAALG